MESTILGLAGAFKDAHSVKNTEQLSFLEQEGAALSGQLFRANLAGQHSGDWPGGNPLVAHSAVTYPGTEVIEVMSTLTLIPDQNVATILSANSIEPCLAAGAGGDAGDGMGGFS